MATLESIVKTLLSRDPLPPLHPKQPWDMELKSQIPKLDISKPAQAALHLLNDDLDACHTIAQDDEGNMVCNHMHAILHRREGDFWNSKYWIGNTRYDLIPNSAKANEARSFVDMDSQLKSSNKEQADKLLHKQMEEMKSVLNFVLAKDNITISSL